MPDGLQGKIGWDKFETQSIAAISLASIGAYLAKAFELTPIGAAVLAGLGATAIVAAKIATRKGKCLRFRWWTAAWMPGWGTGFFYPGSCSTKW